MENALVHAVLDEAGDTGYKAGSPHYLIVAAIVCENLEPLRKIVARTRKTLPPRWRTVAELKASHFPDHIVLRMLHQLAALDIEIFVTALEKKSRKPPADPEELYRNGFGECVNRILAHHRQLIATIDRRYPKNSSNQEKLARVITGQGRAATLTLIMADSEQEKAMQLADAVAWSMFQKYAREEIRFARVIEEKIKEEIVIVK